MYDRAYYELYKGYRGPETPDECEYFIRKLYRQLKKAYTVGEAKAIVEEIYKYKSQKAEMELKSGNHQFEGSQERNQNHDGNLGEAGRNLSRTTRQGGQQQWQNASR